MAIKVTRHENRYELYKKIRITLEDQQLGNIRLYAKDYDDVYLEDFSLHGFAIRFDLGYIPIVPIGQVVKGSFKKESFPICHLEAIPRNMNIVENADHECRIGIQIVGGDFEIWKCIFEILTSEAVAMKKAGITGDHRAEVRYQMEDD